MAELRTVIVLNQDQMGHGDRALGQKILGTFLRKCIAMHGLEAIVFFNAGVRLVSTESPALAELTSLENRGIDLLPCGTCVDALGVDVAVGKVSAMDDIVSELARTEKVVTI